MRLLPDPLEQPTMKAAEVAAAFNISTDAVYDAVRRGDFPVPELHLGRSLRFATARVHDVLGIRDEAPAPTADAHVITLTDHRGDGSRGTG